ncbi:hypothetical protein N9N28_09680 [Rubripirellula amarantea]|nr:hypothetical protein [Rubripirellula amarantea]
MILSDIILGAPHWLIGVVIAAVAFVLAASWSYLTTRGLGLVKTVALLLKVVGVLLLLACLLEPMQRQTRPRPQANVMALLVDDSESMNANFAANKPTRHQVMSQQVASDETDVQPWRTKLAQMFDIRDYAFDSQVRSLDASNGLTGKGRSSSLISSIDSVASRLQHRSMAGVILWTDGNATDLPLQTRDYGELGFPIFPVIDDRVVEMPDLQVADVSVAQTNFETSPTTVSANITSTGITSQSVVVSLMSQASKPKLIQSQTVTVTDGKPTNVTFRFRPEQPGVQFYTVSVAPKNSDAEVTVENNKRTVVVDRDRGPYRVLYVAGRPNWDFKFMRRALGADHEIELVGLLRIAGRQPKFSFRGGASSDTNPLFAGLGKDEEETASQIDEPVMVRLGVKESSELSSGFPQTDEELFLYDALILDDLEADFFNQDQMLRIKRFVDRRGGGLLMMGGQESFDRKSMRGTPLGDLSPVYPTDGLSATDRALDEDQEYTWNLSREGWLSPWLRLRENEATEQSRLQTMPKFRSVNLVGSLKPGARVMVTLTSSDGEPEAALVTQRFGAGRTAALTLGDLWRWSMRTPAAIGGTGSATDLPLEDSSRAWRQLVRWLVNEVPPRVRMEVIPSQSAHLPTQITAMIRDPDFQPLDNAQLSLTVTTPEGESMEVSAEMSDQEPGVYQAEFWHQSTGGYLATLTAENEDGSFIGSDEAGWAVDQAANEWTDLKINTDLLEEIAIESGGQLVRVSELDRFVDELTTRDVPVTETHLVSLWHQSWVMLIAIACLCGEWIIRRTRGLA